MSEPLDFAHQAERFLAELIKVVPKLVDDRELAFATLDELELLHTRLVEGIAEVEAAAAGKPSPRSVRMQAGYDAAAKEQADRRRRETEWAKAHNWEVGTPPAKR